MKALMHLHLHNIISILNRIVVTLAPDHKKKKISTSLMVSKQAML